MGPEIRQRRKIVDSPVLHRSRLEKFTQTIQLLFQYLIGNPNEPSPIPLRAAAGSWARQTFR